MKVSQAPNGGLIKEWTEGVPVEDSAREQLMNAASLPFVHKHIAVMPDVHWGMGATVGSVIPTVGAIVPAAVGVDIGCGMMAVRTTLRADDLPDNLHAIRTEIERAVPKGFDSNQRSNHVKGSWSIIPHGIMSAWRQLEARYDKIVAKYPKLNSKGPASQLGTMGGGNHFIEICLDTEDRVWVMLHSGSRGVGNRIGTFFIEKAKEEMRKYHILKNLPDENLAYLVEHTEIFDDYVEAMEWAQEYAQLNREQMMLRVLEALRKHVPSFQMEKHAINCHHNYVSREHHFGKNVLLTRKGAVSARQGELGIIPGSMGAKSFIVSGKGNPESFHSCSHGAGRAMSRNKAKATFTLEQHKEAMGDIEARADKDVIDETPAAYKSIDAVMAAQSDLVDIVHTLRQIVVVKG